MDQPTHAVKPDTSRPPRRGPARRRALATLTAVTLLAGVFGLGAGLGAARPAEAATVGAGGYADTLPAGRPLPTGCADLSTNPRRWVTANAPKGAVPTNDWWSSILFKRDDCSYGTPLHAHPASYDTFADGLGFSYGSKPTAITGTATGVGEYKYAYSEDIRVGVTGMSSPDVKVDGWSDWTVTPYWSDGTRTMKATIGHGLPFTYFQVTGGDARINGTAGAPAVWSNDGSMIGFTVGGSDYVAYAPQGATWTVNGAAITSSLAGKGFFSVAVLPDVQDKAALAATYARYAHAHVTGTRVSYAYDPSNGTVSTTYGFTTTARQGTEKGTVIALYPHQWNHLTGSTPLTPTYASARGPMKIITGTGFRTTMTYTGVLPEVPAVADGSGADLTAITGYLNAELGDPMAIRGDDTYWTGKGLGRAARIAEIADQLGLTSVRDTALTAIRARMEDWFTATAGKTSRVFYYDRNWGTLIGYPASYGSDTELNDHHFHYGYYIAAAATLAKFQPAWAKKSRYGGMVDLLIRDANNYDRGDERFPYLRDFDIYAGHDWASGHGAFVAGNNQESSSEGMNFANALIQWGQATGDTAVRDAGVYIYTTQAEAIKEYWFDTRDQNFPKEFGHGAVGMVWGDGGAYATWFSAEPEMIQGINMLPITGGHFYLGDDPGYVRRNYDEVVRNNGGEPTVWQDILWEYLALGDGDTALAKLRAAPGYTPEEGESRAHTFHWIRNLAALGTVDATVVADHPLAKVFSKNGARTYVASNITGTDMTVTFSNGTRLTVPAGRTVASGARNWSGGDADGGVTPTATPTATVTPTITPTATITPTITPTPTPTVTVAPFTATRYPQADGTLPGAKGAAGAVTIASAGGVNHDGAPANARVFTATGLTAAYNGGTTAFDLSVDAGTTVGNGTQLRISYDLTGNGTWDRVETYRYFATDPLAGWEHYTQAAGLLSSSGAYGDLAGGTVKVEVWNAIGNGATTLGAGDTSPVRLPFG
ncbi:glycosyl hydrolase [Streptosporangium sp. NPDC004379]|uniref:glycosyl hydrolase n=1 Tax=Streptosporangium sp. NPDC004379 TaxID=3366189 RepID=UPI0036780534